MKLFLVCALAAAMIAVSGRVDFGKDADGQDWMVMNDTDSGGNSQGFLGLAPDGLMFEGKVVLIDGTGFASVRSPFQPQNLEAFSKVKVQYRSQGLPFIFTLETTGSVTDAHYQLALPNTLNEWSTVEINFEELQQFDQGKPTGKTLSKAQQAKIQRIGFATDSEQTATFMLEVNYIEYN